MTGKPVWVEDQDEPVRAFGARAEHVSRLPGLAAWLLDLVSVVRLFWVRVRFSQRLHHVRRRQGEVVTHVLPFIRLVDL
jgi:hypothetical protein